MYTARGAIDSDSRPRERPYFTGSRPRDKISLLACSLANRFIANIFIRIKNISLLFLRGIKKARIGTRYAEGANVSHYCEAEADIFAHGYASYRTIFLCIYILYFM